jgi:hypothetical protein
MCHKELQINCFPRVLGLIFCKTYPLCHAQHTPPFYILLEHFKMADMWTESIFKPVLVIRGINCYFYSILHGDVLSHRLRVFENRVLKKTF